MKRKSFKKVCLAINSLLQESLVIEDTKGSQRYTISDRL
jgi:hypothetical protein